MLQQIAFDGFLLPYSKFSLLFLCICITLSSKMLPYPCQILYKIHGFGGSDTHSSTCLMIFNLVFSQIELMISLALCILIPQMDKSGSQTVGSSHFKGLPAVTSEQAHLWNGVYSNFFPSYEVQKKSSSYSLVFCCFPFQLLVETCG